MIKKLKKLIRDKKREKLMKEANNVPILIPSLEKFIDTFKSNIRKQSSLHYSSEQSINSVIDRFHTIAVEAMVDTLIDVGYKKGK